MSALLDALGYLGQTLDKPGASVRGLLAGRPGQLANLVPFSDTFGLTDPSQRTSGRDLLEAYGAVGQNQEGLDLGDVAGFGAELATDPLNWLGAAGLARTGMAAKSAKANNVLRDALLAKGAMPEEIAGLTKVVDEAGNPIRTYHGTGRVFDAYNIDKMDPGSLYGPGIYTTVNPEVASEYAVNKAGPIDYFVTPGREQDALAFIKQDPVVYAGWAKGLTDQQALERAAAAYGEKLYSGEADSLPEVARELFGFAPTKPNVRMQYMDVRNPFDIDAAHEVAALPPPLNKKGFNAREALLASKDANYMALNDQLASHQANVGDLWDSIRDAQARGYSEQAQRLQVKALQAEIRRKEIEATLRRMEEEAAPPPGWTQTGDQIFQTLAGSGDKAAAFNKIKEAGYDALTHVGGNRTGTVPHHVWIATDPSQIYAPFLAPAQKDVPRMSPLLAALGGYQAGVLPGRLGGAR